MGKTGWTARDDRDWRRLSAKGYHDRSVDEELRYEQLKATRELIQMETREQIRKHGPLYWPAIIVFLISMGSCVGGLTGGGASLVIAGVVLACVSSFLNWLNGKATGIE